MDIFFQCLTPADKALFLFFRLRHIGNHLLPTRCLIALVDDKATIFILKNIKGIVNLKLQNRNHQ